MNIAFETANPRLQNILSRLKGVKKVGPNTYRAYSPLRDEKEPSLYITEKSDGTILMCDHGGGDTKATLAAIGLTMCILFPCTMRWYWKRRKQSSWLKARKT